MVTFIVGQNGSGKSTLVEGIAVAAGAEAGLSPRSRPFSNDLGRGCVALRHNPKRKAQPSAGHLL